MPIGIPVGRPTFLPGEMDSDRPYQFPRLNPNDSDVEVGDFSEMVARALAEAEANTYQGRKKCKQDRSCGNDARDKSAQDGDAKEGSHSGIKGFFGRLLGKR